MEIHVSDASKPTSRVYAIPPRVSLYSGRDAELHENDISARHYVHFRRDAARDPLPQLARIRALTNKAISARRIPRAKRYRERVRRTPRAEFTVTVVDIFVR